MLGHPVCGGCHVQATRNDTQAWTVPGFADAPVRSRIGKFGDYLRSVAFENVRVHGKTLGRIGTRSILATKIAVA